MHDDTFALGVFFARVTSLYKSKKKHKKNRPRVRLGVTVIVKKLKKK